MNDVLRHIGEREVHKCGNCIRVLKLLLLEEHTEIHVVE